MKNAIIEKLKLILRKSEYSEQDIIYILVESYKLYELEGRPNNFDVIRFYRNWACHSSLSDDAKNIFDEVYILIRARDYMADISWQDLMTNQIEKSFNNYSFSKFKTKFEEFSNLFLDAQAFNWVNFRMALYDVILDTPLKIKRSGNEIFRFECKRYPIASMDFNDVQIYAVTGNVHFNLSLNDEVLN